MPSRKYFVVIGRMPDRENSIWEGAAEDDAEALDNFRAVLEFEEDHEVVPGEIIYEAVLSSNSRITFHQN